MVLSFHLLVHFPPWCFLNEPNPPSLCTSSYFNLRGLGEKIRLLLEVAAIPYEDHRITSEEWPVLKESMPFGQVGLFGGNPQNFSHLLLLLAALALWDVLSPPPPESLTKGKNLTCVVVCRPGVCRSALLGCGALQVPQVEITEGDKTLTMVQSNAIVRYIARKAGLSPIHCTRNPVPLFVVVVPSEIRAILVVSLLVKGALHSFFFFLE